VTPDGAVAVTWDESVGGRRQAVLAAGRVRADGLRLSRRVLSVNEPASYPVVTVSGRQILSAWTAGPSSASIIRLGRMPLER
jgi:hypothetical protein